MASRSSRSHAEAEDQPDQWVNKPTIREDPRQLTITMQPNVPFLWSRIEPEILPFLRCRKECFGGVEMYEPCPVDWLRQQQSSTAPPKPRASVGKRLAATMKTSLFITPPAAFPILSLSTCLFLRVFDFVMEPYELEASTLYGLVGTPHLMINPARTWSSMKIFHVCKAFREVAIGIYGEPSRYALPFNPNIDKIVIRGFASALDVLAKSPMPVARGEGLTHWSNQIGGFTVSFYDLPASLKNPNILPNDAGNDFLRRVKCIDIQAYDGSLFNRRHWSIFFSFLSNSFRCLKTLKVSVWHYDDCKIAEDNGLGQHDEGMTNVNAYCAHDASMIAAFGPIPPVAHELYEPRLFPALEHLEIIRIGTKCSLELHEYSVSFLFRNHLFSKVDHSG
ncbi:hypothetical protein AAE478_008960 [Parahypoxylon ruwenzoriense]